MSAHELIAQHREEIVVACQRFGVVRLRLFGSGVRSTWNERTSDLDFLVEYGPDRRKLPPLDQVVGLPMALEQILGRPVDSVDWGAVKNPYFRESAERDAVTVYAA